MYLAMRSVREALPVLIWPASGAYGEVGDEGVFGFAGAVADDAGVAEAAGQFDGFEGLGDGADLVDLDQDGVGDLLLDSLLEALGVGDEEVVADELDLVAEDVW